MLRDFVPGTIGRWFCPVHIRERKKLGTGIRGCEVGTVQETTSYSYLLTG